MKRFLAPGGALGLLVLVLPALLAPAAPLAAVQTPATQPAKGAAAVPAAAPTAPPSAAQKSLEDALNRVDKGDVAGAIQVLEALRKDPAVTPPVLALLGALYLKANRAKEALAVLRPIADAPDADPAVLWNAGRAAFAQSENELGQTYLERSVALAPGSPAARALGLLYARAGRPRPAYEVLYPWVVANPGDEEARFAAILLAINLQQLNAADEMLKGLPLTNPRVRLLSGDLALRKGDPKACIATLRTLIDNPPPGFDTNAGMELDARRLLAEAYLRTGQSADAAKILVGRGNDASTALLLAQAQYQGGDLNAALATLSPWADKILKAEKPRDSDLVADMALTWGRMLFAAGKNAEAVEALAVATHFDPESATAWQSYGQALQASGKKDEAAQALNRFKDLSVAKAKAKLAAATGSAAPGGAAGSQDQAGLELLAKGEFDKALTAAQEQIRRSPKELGPRVLELRALLALKRNDDALKTAQAMVDLAPGSPDAVYSRAVANLALQKNTEGEADLRLALKVQPGYLPAMNDLAVLLMLRGEKNDKAEARGLLERVVKANPKDKVAAANLEKLKAEAKAGG